MTQQAERGAPPVADPPAAGVEKRLAMVSDPEGLTPSASSTPARFLPCGDTALTVELGDRVDLGVNALVLDLAYKVKAAAVAGIVELVPTFRSLTIHYDPLIVAQSDIEARLRPLLSGLSPAGSTGRLWRIPVCYHESVAPDLAEVAGRTGLGMERVVELHSRPTYHVYMVGFLPGYPYLGELPGELVLPRRESPRTAVPAGAVAIATTLTAIYPLESPGGWHLIGRTPAPLWDGARDPPVLLAPGDKVRFQPIPLGDYAALASRAARGEMRLEPEAAPAAAGAPA
jgi:KipI family sensor histidine kinase inhibitor